MNIENLALVINPCLTFDKKCDFEFTKYFLVFGQSLEKLLIVIGPCLQFDGKSVRFYAYALAQKNEDGYRGWWGF